MPIPDGTMEYEAEGHLYHLLPVWVYREKRIYVLRCKMYRDGATFVGFWSRPQMPLKLIVQLQHHIAWLEILGFTSNGTDTFAPRSDYNPFEDGKA